jgi:hypothetical protein
MQESQYCHEIVVLAKVIPPGHIQNLSKYIKLLTKSLKAVSFFLIQKTLCLDHLCLLYFEYKQFFINLQALDIISRVIRTLRLLTRKMPKATAKVSVSTVYTAMVFHMEKNSVKAELSIYGLQIQI